MSQLLLNYDRMILDLFLDVLNSSKIRASPWDMWSYPKVTFSFLPVDWPILYSSITILPAADVTQFGAEIEWRLVDWLVGLRIGRFFGWWIVWFVCWWIGWIVGCSAVRLVCWLIDWLVCRLLDWLVCLLVDWLRCLLVDWLVSVSKC